MLLIFIINGKPVCLIAQTPENKRIQSKGKLVAIEGITAETVITKLMESLVLINYSKLLSYI